MTQLSVAIPDSSLSDEQTRRDKTIKVGQFARAFSIFRVRKVIIFHDSLTRFSHEDPLLLKTLLQFLDTPQYLRRRLYPLSPLLEYAGLLHPLKAPHHKPAADPKKMKIGEKRTGVLTRSNGRMSIDVGLGFQIPFKGEGQEGEKVVAKFTSVHPHFIAVRASGLDADYWGYVVKDVGTLSEVFAERNQALHFVTSRKGLPFDDLLPGLVEQLAIRPEITLIFGSPKNGVDDILRSERGSILRNCVVANMFPRQATETVRLEEAILGSLAILNVSIRIQ